MEFPHNAMTDGKDIEVVADDGARFSFRFEQGGRWDDRENRRIPNPYVTAWVRSGWPGYDEARRMYPHDWCALIARALGWPRERVRVGFSPGDFDVRPF
jgi:hypothetical protein